MSRAQRRRESIARIAAEASELMVLFPDLSVSQCLEMAEYVEWAMYGDPDTPEPIGILNGLE